MRFSIAFQVTLFGCALNGSAQLSGRACASYQQSGPMVVQKNNQVIQNLIITSTGGPGISVNGYSGVKIQNVVIHHNGGAGILLSNANSTTVTNADIVFDGAPQTGPNPDASDVNIDCENSTGLSVSNVRLTRGSSGIYLNYCPNSKLSMIEGHDQRGPFPRGQLVQWGEQSNNGSLTNFSDENSLLNSWTEDNLNIYHATGIVIQHGLLDTNNSPSGSGLLVDQNSGNVSVQDVDAVHQGNGCFGVYGGGGHDVTFLQTRCRDNYCTLPRGTPSSGSLAFAFDPLSVYGDLKLEQSLYFNLCNPGNIVWDANMLSVDQLSSQNFTPKAPLRVKLCEYGY